MKNAEFIINGINITRLLEGKEDLVPNFVPYDERFSPDELLRRESRDKLEGVMSCGESFDLSKASKT